VSFAGTRDARVFDAFAGAGELYAAVWREAATYTGCDLRYMPMRGDGRLMFAADNRRVLRAIDLAAFNVFDLDSYGSPFECAIIIAARRKVQREEPIGLVLTCGEGIAIKAGAVPHALTELTGFRPGLPGTNKHRGWLIDRAISNIAKRMRCTQVKRWEAAGRTGAAVIYIGVLLRGFG